MQFLSTIVVFISAFTLINGKSTGADLIDNIDQIFQSGNLVGSRQKGPDLTPIKKEDDGCPCISPVLCFNKFPIKEKPCTGDTCNTPVTMRLNDGTCSNGLVRCCRDGVYTTARTPAESTPDLTPVNKPTPYCPCIPVHQCENGIPCTDGCDAIDPKINDGTCPTELGYVRCCNEVSNTSTVTPPIIKTPKRPILNPGHNPTLTCPCIPYYQCENGTPCTDGCDLIDSKINDGITCSEPEHIRCCNKVNTSTVPPPIITTPKRPILNPGRNPSLSCPCIPYYQCENGTPCTDGCDAIDPKINDGTCSIPGYIPCCNRVNNSTTVATETSTNQNRLNLTPQDNMSSCPCVPYYQCYNGTACTDGCDVINVRINDDTCPDPSHVRCCKGVNITVTPPVSGNTPDITRNNQPPSCPCVNHYNCYNGTPCIDGCGVIDMRINHDSCKLPNVLCCEQTNTSLPNMTPPTNNIKPTPASPGASYRSRCGVRNPNGIGFRIQDTSVRQNLAKFGEFPWMVAILWEDKDTSDTQEYYPEQTLLKYQCGGSLIHPQVVLTSTHCVVSNEKIFHVRAGEWDIKSTTENYPHQDRLVEKVITHPDYYSGGLYNDIALLILKTPVNITRNVDTVCLPAQDEILENVRCYTSGWGRNDFEMNGQYETTLKKVELPIVQKDLCQTQYKTARSQEDFILHDSFVCAGGEKGKDACEGDGGSPLVCPFSSNHKRYFQAGIVSWGIGCGLENIPGLYANVARFRNWVDEHMIKLGYDISYYTY